MNVDISATEAEAAANIAEMAKEAFAKHTVKYLSRGEWICKRPGSGTYSFRLIVRPMTIIVWGDIGDWIVSMNDAHAIPWLRRALRDPEYLISKIQAAPEGRRTFYWKDALAWLQEGSSHANHCDGEPADEIDTRYDDVISEIDPDDLLTHERFCEVMHDHEFDDFGTIGVGPSARCFWLVEALRWFVAHADWSEVEPEAVTDDERAKPSPPVTLTAASTAPTLSIGSAGYSLRSCDCNTNGFIISASRDHCAKPGCTCRCHPENR